MSLSTKQARKIQVLYLKIELLIKSLLYLDPIFIFSFELVHFFQE